MRILRIVALASFVGMSLAGLVCAQENKVPTIDSRGYHFVCHILHTLDMTPIVELKEAGHDPEQTVIIVLALQMSWGRSRRKSG